MGWVPVDENAPVCLPHHNNIPHPHRLMCSSDLKHFRLRQLECTHLPAAVLQFLSRRHRPDCLSSVQVDSLHLMFRQPSFWIADGPGTGKGRLLASRALLHLAVHPNGRVLWLSANQLLKHCAHRELHTVGANPAHIANVQFESYPRLIQNCAHHVCTLRQHTEVLLIFDEVHLGKQGGSTQAAIMHLQAELPDAAVVYSTATAGSCEKHRKVMTRMPVLSSPVHLIEQWAASGCYQANCLTDSMQVGSVSITLTAYQEELYDHACHMFDALHMPVTNSMFFHATRQRFFRTLIAALKAPHAIRHARQILAAGSSVVIGVQGTGGSSCVRRRRRGDVGSSTLDEMAAAIGLGQLPEGFKWPRDPLDELLSELREDGVAEITGRSCRLQGRRWECCPGVKKEYELFQTGRKSIAIISRRGSMGLDFVAEHKRTVHLLLELPWSGEQMLQHCGRTRRASARHMSTVQIMCSNIPAEARFQTGLQKKLVKNALLQYGDASMSFRLPDSVPHACTSADRQRAMHALLFVLTTSRRLSSDPTYCAWFALSSRLFRMVRSSVDLSSYSALLSQTTLCWVGDECMIRTRKFALIDKLLMGDGSHVWFALPSDLRRHVLMMSMPRLTNIEQTMRSAVSLRLFSENSMNHFYNQMLVIPLQHQRNIVTLMLLDLD